MESLSEFYFVRHGETDHNKFQIHGDTTDVDINETGRRQAAALKEPLYSLTLKKVVSSPHLRAKSTRDIALGDRIRQLNLHVYEELTECTSEIWLNLVEIEKGDEKEPLPNTAEFLDRIKSGLDQILASKEPTLIIAHGGTFWAFCHHLEISASRNISNCVLVKFTKGAEGWTYEPVLSGKA